MNIKKEINNLYKTAVGKNKKSAACALFYIIQIKEEYPDYINLGQSLYLDIWDFVLSYIESIKNKDYGYDSLNIEKIKKAIKTNQNVDERFQLFSRAFRKLEEEGFTQDSKELKTNIKRCLISSLFHSQRYKNKFRAIICCCSYNLWSVSCILVALIITYILITLPLSDSNCCLFIIQYENYSESSFFNHILNIIGDVLEYNNNKFCKPVNLTGFLFVSIFKLLFAIFFAGWFMKYFGEKTKVLFDDYEG